jgi:GAF domain-containing protein
VRWFHRSDPDTDDVDVESCLANLDRLEAVRASGLIGAPPSAALDGLTRVAAERLHTPMAFVSVLDDRRAHFVSVSDPGATGLVSQPSVSAEETFCQFVVATEEPLIVADSLLDPRVSSIPSATSVRSYLGVPLRSDGHVLGSFCVVDTHAREWTASELAELEELAATALASVRG